MRFDTSGLTDVGCVRPSNEDSIAWWSCENTRLEIAVVADGMGGHAGGALASRIAAKSVLTTCISDLKKGNPDITGEVVPLLVKAAHSANHAVRQARVDYPEFAHMGSTLVIAALGERTAAIVHAGDSRCYKLSSDTEGYPHLQQLTRDDSVVQAMLEEGSIRASDIPHLPYRNVLTKALGPEEEPSFTVNCVPVYPGDSLLLCSDGFYNAVTEDEILTTVQRFNDSQSIVNALVNLSIRNGAEDNTSVIMMRLEPALHSALSS